MPPSQIVAQSELLRESGYRLDSNSKTSSTSGRVDVAQPDVGRVGGITEAKRVMEFADMRGRLVIPHCWKTGIGIAASAHLAAASSNCPFIEYLPGELSESLIRKELVSDELRMENGVISLPRKPGLGIELNESAIKKYKVS